MRVNSDVVKWGVTLRCITRSDETATHTVPPGVGVCTKISIPQQILGIRAVLGARRFLDVLRGFT